MKNMITGIRIGCALLLLFFPTFSVAFYILYIVGGLSDVFDGIVARHFGGETEFGAKFDSIADIIFIGIVLIKILNTVSIPMGIILWIVAIGLIKCINIFVGLIFRKTFVSEHTLLNKICGIMVFAFPLYIDRFPEWIELLLFILTCLMATVASIQEGYLILGESEHN